MNDFQLHLQINQDTFITIKKADLTTVRYSNLREAFNFRQRFPEKFDNTPSDNIALPLYSRAKSIDTTRPLIKKTELAKPALEPVKKKFTYVEPSDNKFGVTAATLVNKRFIFVTTDKKKVYKYDLLENRWTLNLPEMNSERVGHSACALGSKLYVIGGAYQSRASNSVEVLDTAAQYPRW